MRFSPFAVSIALIALAGCAGSGSTGSGSCTPIAVSVPAPPALLVPAPGAAGVPSSVTVQVSYDPPQGTLRAVPQGNGPTVGGTAFAPAPGVTPPAQTVVSTLSPLAPSTTYTLYVDAVYPPEPPCTEGERAGPTTFNLGTISTQ